MRSKSSIYNIIAAIILQLITLIIGIILPRIMLVHFGSEINGLVSSIKQFINYLTLVEAGLAGAAVYSLYKPLAEKDYIQLNNILSDTRRLYNRSGIVFSILALVLSVVFPFIVTSNTVDFTSIFMLVLILGINGALEFFSMGKYRALLTADQKGYVISVIQMIGQIINAIIIILLTVSVKNIVVVQFFATFSYVIRAILLHAYVKKKYIYVRFNVLHDKQKKYLEQRWDVLLHQLGGMIIFSSPIALITFFCTLEEVSVYAVYNMVFSGIMGIIGIFNGALMAGIGEIISRKDIDKLKNIYREYECGYYCMVTWVYSCTYILIIPFMKIYTKGIDDINYISLDLTIGLIIIGVLNSLRMPQSTVVNAAGHFKNTRNRVILEIIINLTASIIFVKCFGMIGVVLGGICSYTYRTLDFIIYVPKHITNLKVKETLIRIVRGIILGIIIVIPFQSIIHIQVQHFIGWCVWGFIVAIWAGVVVFLGNYVVEKAVISNLVYRVLMVIGKKA